MTDEEPERLKATGDAPDELVRALRALGRDRDSERLARVAERLTATLAATGAPAGSWLQNVLGSKLALLGVVVGLGVLGALGYQLATAREAPVEQPAAPAPVAPSTIAPQAAPAREPAQASEPAPARSSGDRADTPRSKRAPRRASGSTSNGPVRSAIETSTTAQAEAEPTPEPADEEEADAPEEPKPTAQPPAEPPASEELLVHRARKAAAREPATALRLLDEHAKRFPNGLLTPEREVLAIEVLRNLGRNAEAEQRLQRFQERYPQSIHLRRLEQGRAAERND